MLKVLNNKKIIDLEPMLETEWTYANANNELPERESGNGKGPKSPLRGAWGSKEEFVQTFPAFIVNRILKKLSWSTWQTNFVQRIRKDVSKVTALRGLSPHQSSTKTTATPPMQTLQVSLNDKTLDALVDCVIGSTLSSPSFSPTKTTDSVLTTKLALRCYPLLLDTPGVVTNGISDDVGSFVLPHHVKARCPGVLPACGRAAVELLLERFSQHRFSMLSSLGLTTWSGR